MKFLHDNVCEKSLKIVFLKKVAVSSFLFANFIFLLQSQILNNTSKLPLLLSLFHSILIQPGPLDHSIDADAAQAYFFFLGNLETPCRVCGSSDSYSNLNICNNHTRSSDLFNKLFLFSPHRKHSSLQISKCDMGDRWTKNFFFCILLILFPLSRFPSKNKWNPVITR